MGCVSLVWLGCSSGVFCFFTKYMCSLAEGNVHVRKCTFLLLLKWYSPLNSVVYVAFIGYCEILYSNTAKQMLLS